MNGTLVPFLLSVRQNKSYSDVATSRTVASSLMVTSDRTSSGPIRVTVINAMVSTPCAQIGRALKLARNLLALISAALIQAHQPQHTKCAYNHTGFRLPAYGQHRSINHYNTFPRKKPRTRRLRTRICIGHPPHFSCPWHAPQFPGFAALHAFAFPGSCASSQFSTIALRHRAIRCREMQYRANLQ